jgi:hypothetical protein
MDSEAATLFVTMKETGTRVEAGCVHWSGNITILKEECPVGVYWKRVFVDGINSTVMFGLDLPLSRSGSSPRRVCPIRPYELI